MRRARFVRSVSQECVASACYTSVCRPPTTTHGTALTLIHELEAGVVQHVHGIFQAPSPLPPHTLPLGKLTFCSENHGLQRYMFQSFSRGPSSNICEATRFFCNVTEAASVSKLNFRDVHAGTLHDHQVPFVESRLIRDSTSRGIPT